jgi:hypothetical protein
MAWASTLALVSSSLGISRSTSHYGDEREALRVSKVHDLVQRSRIPYRVLDLTKNQLVLTLIDSRFSHASLLRRSTYTLRLLVSFLKISTLLVAGCLWVRSSQVEITTGLTPGEVRDALGAPIDTREFVMPDGTFFGPQEALSGLVPAGGLVEEWRYESNDEVRYFWFYGDPEAGREGRRLVATATVPKDAVY